MTKLKPNTQKKKVEKIKINTTKIGSFLKSLTSAEWHYLQNTVHIAMSVQKMIRCFGLTKEEFCNGVGIKPRQYNDCVCGKMNYDLWFIARLEVFNKTLLKQEADKAEIVRIAKSKEDESKRKS